MKITSQRIVTPEEITQEGQRRDPALSNGGEHLFVDIDPGQHQTISCKLPNGKAPRLHLI